MAERRWSTSRQWRRGVEAWQPVGRQSVQALGIALGGEPCCWCVADGGRLRLVDAYHPHPIRQAALDAMVGQAWSAGRIPGGASLRSRVATLLPIAEVRLSGLAGPWRDLLTDEAPATVLAVPPVRQGRAQGLLLTWRAGDRPPYSDDDVETARRHAERLAAPPPAPPARPLAGWRQGVLDQLPAGVALLRQGREVVFENARFAAARESPTEVTAPDAATATGTGVAPVAATATGTGVAPVAATAAVTGAAPDNTATGTGAASHPLPWASVARRVAETGQPVLDALDEQPDPLDPSRLTAHLRSWIPVPGTLDTRDVLVLDQDVSALATRLRSRETMVRVAEALAGVRTDEEFGATVLQVLTTRYAARGALAIAVPGDALRMVAFQGYDASLIQAATAQDLPLSFVSPLTDAARTREPVIIGNGAQFALQHPELDEQRRVTGDEAVASVPLIDVTGEGHLLAVLHLTWQTPREFDDHDAEMLTSLSVVGSAALSRLRAEDRARVDLFRRALDAVLDEIVIAEAIRGDDGQIDDFQMLHLNAHARDFAGRTRDQLIGMRLLQAYPSLRGSEQFERFVEVVETGRPWVAHEVPFRDTIDGVDVEGWWSGQTVKFDDGYLMSWRSVTDAVLAAREQAEQRLALAREHEMVQVLRDALLPSDLPTVPGYEIDGWYEPAGPAALVGGDWYDAFTLPDGTLVLVVGDAAGHGVPATAAMAQVRHLVRAFCVDAASPAVVLERVDRTLRTVAPEVGTYVTCALAWVTPASGSVLLASAGHLPPLVVTDTAATLVPVAPAPPLGLFRAGATPPPVVEHTVEPGATVVLFTDGLVERRGHAVDDGMAQLVVQAAPILRSRPPRPASRIASLRTVLASREDDACVLALRRCP